MGNTNRWNVFGAEISGAQYFKDINKESIFINAAFMCPYFIFNLTSNNITIYFHHDQIFFFA